MNLALDERLKQFLQTAKKETANAVMKLFNDKLFVVRPYKILSTTGNQLNDYDEKIKWDKFIEKLDTLQRLFLKNTQIINNPNLDDHEMQYIKSLEIPVKLQESSVVRNQSVDFENLLSAIDYSNKATKTIQDVSLMSYLQLRRREENDDGRLGRPKAAENA